MTNESALLLAGVALLIYFDSKQTKVQATNDAARQVGQGIVDGVGAQLQGMLGQGQAPTMDQYGVPYGGSVRRITV